MNAKRTSSPFQRFEYCRKTGMLCSWLPHANESVFWTHMFSPDSAPGKRSRVSLVTPRHGSLPWFGAQKISDGKLHDVNILDRIAFEAGSIVVMDRGYIDFARLHALHLAQAFFVTRAKSNLQYRRVYSHPVDKTTGLRCDQTIMLTGPRPSQDYPVQLRRVKFYDAKHDKLLVFLTNNFDLPALTIAELYRCRWQVELFFKWINLKTAVSRSHSHDLRGVDDIEAGRRRRGSA